MKKLYLIALSFLMSIGAFAQYDVGCTAILIPADGDTILPQDLSSFSLIYTRENFGPDVPASDTVFMDILINGNLFTSLVRTPSVFQSGDVDTSGFLNENLSGLLSPGSYQICVASRLYSASDTNSTNDTACINLEVAEMDIEMDSIAITDPVLADDTIDFNTTVNEMLVQIRNRSAVTLPQGLSVGVELVVDGSSNGLSMPINSDLAPGQTTNEPIPAGLIPAFPTTEKTFDICLNVTDPNDNNTANDQKCLTYFMNDPSNDGGNNNDTTDTSGTSINRVTSGSAALFTQYNNSLLFNTARVEQAEVIDISGKTVQKISLTARREQTLNTLKQGIYVVKMRLNDGSTQAEKIFVK